MEVKRITKKQMNEIFETGGPEGLFYYQGKELITAIDNTGGLPIVETFLYKGEAIAWLEMLED